MTGFEFLILIAKLLFLFFGVIMPLASFSTWVERKGSALIQDRVGANRAGAYFDFNLDVVRRMNFVRTLPDGLRGIGAIVVYAVLFVPVLMIKFAGKLGIINTLVNDAVKALFKEDFVPEGVSNFMHCLAPFLAVVPVFLAFAIIPLAPDFELAGSVIRPQAAPLGVGVLFFLSMGSIAVYGVALAGWTGNNKYSLLGGLRAAAQMISYELAMGLTIVTMILIFGTADLYDMVEAQKGSILNWGIFSQGVVGFIAFVVLFIVGMAETKRAPFDLPEAESELIAGYFTEYSGMKFLIFWLGEFAEIGLFSSVITVLFLGGWHIPWLEFPALSGLGALVGFLVFMAKVHFLCVLQIVIRWTLPRFRYDQLMHLGWKILLPISMVTLVLSAALKLVY